MQYILASKLAALSPGSQDRPEQLKLQLAIEFPRLSCDNASAFRREVVRLRLLFSIFALSSLAFAGTFDKPASKKVVDLGPSRSNPPGRNANDQTRAKVTCYYFSGFMVKEVDMGEKGAERLAIVPVRKNEMHTCSRLLDPGERKISSDDWSGYFMGVKGRLVFFSADDGWNGGLGFAVFDSRTARKIFDDVALGNLDFSDAGTNTSFRYTRVVDGGCIIPKEQSACWDKIKSKLALGAASMPDCNGGYEKSAQDLAKGRCQAQNADNPQCVAKEISLARQQSNEANSVIAYPVEVTVLSAGVSIKSTGEDLRCWPSD